MKSVLWLAAPAWILIACPAPGEKPKPASESAKPTLASAPASTPSPPPEGMTQIDVMDVIRRVHTEGAPFDTLRALGPAAIPQLKTMLKTADAKPYWPNVVGALGAIGGADASATLIAFVDGLKGRDLDGESFRAGLDAITALGYAANDGDEQSLAYLRQAVEELRKGSAPDPDARGPRLDPPTMGPTAVMALGLSGHAKAASVLKNLQADRTVSADVRESAAEAMKTWSAVNASGLSTYLRRE